jgi:hypothetical protein
MNVFAATVISLAGLLTASCSEKSDPARGKKSDQTEQKTQREQAEESPSRDRSEEHAKESTADTETEEEPEAEDIGMDSVAFLRATTVAPVDRARGDCPTCPPSSEAAEVLRFRDIKIDQVSPSGDTCEASVRILATFNPSHGGTIIGGLTKWISPEQKAQYAKGETPSGQQVYPVKVTYRRTATGWRAVEFN